jgi:peptidoglycan/LPS O-acetylase OafA/YrhL
MVGAHGLIGRAMPTTIAQRMSETGGRPTGFDYLRLGLAVTILCWHSVVTSYGSDVQTAVDSSLARPLMAVLLPAFFTLSGFLVAGSLERSKTIGMFVGLRAIRIFPALAVESLIAALILGPLLTTRPVLGYFADPQFHAYFLNILGDPHFYLPGVFTSTPFNQVNSQLATIPYELRCYIMLTALALLGAVRRPVVLLGAMLALTALGIGWTAIDRPHDLTEASGPVAGWLLIVSFLAGVLIYLYRERIAWRWRWGVGALVLGLVLLDVPMGETLAVFPLAYATVFFGLTNAPKTGVLKGADYSYGIFLYGFAVQQTYVLLAPDGRHWWLNIAVTLPATTAVAALSWHLVEKPALGLRTQLAKLEARWLARPSRASALLAGGSRSPTA